MNVTATTDEIAYQPIIDANRVDNLTGKTNVSSTPSLNNIIVKVAETSKMLQNASTELVNMIPINVSPMVVKYKSKDKREKEAMARKVHKTFNRKTNQVIDWHKLKDICLKHPIVPASLNGIRLNKNFHQSQCVFVDFDDSISLAEFLEDAISKSIIPNLIYQTLSCNEKYLLDAKRFRAVFILSKLITELKLYKMVQSAFLYVFPSADKNSFKATQFFYSGKQSEIIIEMPTDVERLLELSTSYALEKTTTDKQAKDLLYNINKRNERYDLCVKEAETPIRKKRYFNPKKLAESSELFQVFDSGEVQVMHPQLMGLYSLCRQYEHGIKYWKDKVARNEKIDNVKLRSIHRFIENRYANFAEQRAVKYLPEGDSGLRFGFLSEALVRRNRKARPNPNWKGRVVHGSVDDVNAAFRKELTIGKNKKNKITVIKCQAGVGKSTALLDYDLSNTIIVAPNHRLNIEIEKRLRA